MQELEPGKSERRVTGTNRRILAPHERDNQHGVTTDRNESVFDNHRFNLMLCAPISEFHTLDEL